MSNIQSLVSEFAGRIEALVEASVKERVDAVFAQIFPVAKRGRGRPAQVRFGGRGRDACQAIEQGAEPGSQARDERQGIYLGLLKGLTGSDRERVKAAAEEGGVEAAIALGQKLKK